MQSRNARTFDRIKKMILKGSYDKSELMLDIVDFLDMGTLTEEEFSTLLVLIEENPPRNTYTLMDSDGQLISNNTFILLHKQIIKKVYVAEIIEQIVTDFKITGAISRTQFSQLRGVVDEVYYPTFDTPADEEQPPELVLI